MFCEIWYNMGGTARAATNRKIKGPKTCDANSTYRSPPKEKRTDVVNPSFFVKYKI